MLMRHQFRHALFVLTAFGLQTVPAIAQPTAEQQSALRNNCRSDFMAHCSDTQPGGAQALQCLQRNIAELSPGCQNAVNALVPSAPQPQPAAAPPSSTPAAAAETAAAPPSASSVAAPRAGGLTPKQQNALRQFCGADYMAKCGHVAPATAEALQCMQAHEAELSANCRGALVLIGADGSSPPAQTAAPPSAPAAAATAEPAAGVAKPNPATAAAKPAAVAKPTAQQRAAIRQSCRSDFLSHCSGVQPGGAAAFQCLQRNSAQLSASCRSAIAALGGAAAATPAAAAASAQPAAAAAAPSQRQLSAIKANCRRDFMANCRGVAPGGPEALACLQRNSARLSPNCRTSVAGIAGGQPETATATPDTAPAPEVRPIGPIRRAIRRRMEMRQMEMQE